MSIRKIKADVVEIEGEYLRIEHYSRRSYGGIIGFIFAVLLLLGIDGTTIFVDGVLIILMTSVGAGLAQGRVIRQIPLVDLVEIKEYPTSHRVTIVLDDARTKRRQAVAVSETKK